MSRMRVVLAAATVAACLFTSSSTWARDAIRWGYFQFPPVFVEQASGVGGFGGEVLETLRRGMPEYGHNLESMPPRRILENMRQGENVCSYGVFRTSERETYLSFSLPCRLVPPPILILRGSDASRLPESRTVSLRRFLREESLTLGLTAGVSFGEEADTALAEADPAKVRRFYHADLGEHIYEMLRQGHIDATMHDVFQHAHLTAANGAESEFVWARIEEAPSWRVGHVVCPDTDWGRDVIGKVDEILRRELRAERLRSVFEPYVPEGMREEFAARFDELIRKPAQEAREAGN